MSKKCQDYILQVAWKYLSGFSFNDTIIGMKKNERGYAIKIWERIENSTRPRGIRRAIAEQAVLLTGEHPEDLLRKDNEQLFSERVVTYLKRLGQQNKLVDIAEKIGDDCGKNLINYINNGKGATRRDLVVLARNPELYDLLGKLIGGVAP